MSTESFILTSPENTSLWEALGFLTEKTLGVLEEVRDLKTTPKSKINRYERIASIGILGLGWTPASWVAVSLPLVEEKLKTFPRVEVRLKAQEESIPETRTRVLHTLEDSFCYVLDCMLATVEDFKDAKHYSKKELASIRRATDGALKVAKNYNLRYSMDRVQCSRVAKALGYDDR